MTFIKTLPFLLASCVSGTIWASPMASVPIPSLVATADLILIATVKSDVRIGVASAVTLEHQTILKGDSPAGSLVNATLPLVSRNRTPFPDTLRVLVFLKRAANRLEILPGMAGAQELREAVFILPTKPSPSKPLGATPLDKVLEVLSDALGNIPPEYGARVSLVSVARTTKSPVLRAAFLRYLSHAEPRTRETAIAGLLAMNELSGLTAAQSDPAVLKNGAVLQEIKWSYIASDSSSISALARLTKASDEEVKLAAAAALARVHTPATLPLLAELLNSDSPRIQAAAVGGLSMFANHVPIGTHHPAPGEWKYRTDRTMQNSAMDERVIRNNPAIVAFWKAWWTEHKEELTR